MGEVKDVAGRVIKRMLIDSHQSPQITIEFEDGFVYQMHAQPTIELKDVDLVFRNNIKRDMGLHLGVNITTALLSEK